VASIEVLTSSVDTATEPTGPALDMDNYSDKDMPSFTTPSVSYIHIFSQKKTLSWF
jgi:hypothetical protein